MNRNTKSFDNNVVSLDIARSSFNRNASIKTSFNVGDIVPFYVDEVLPGDTFKITTWYTRRDVNFAGLFCRTPEIRSVRH